MDENQIEPDMNTTPLQMYVRDGHTLVGKPVPLQLEGRGFKPQWGQSAGLWAGSGTRWENFCFCFFAAFLL